MFQKVEISDLSKSKYIELLKSKSITAYWLACHSALPLFFRMDFLFHLWINFKNSILNITENQPFYSDIADVINFGLAYQIGNELYEYDENTRNFLLYNLQEKFGVEYVKKLATFVYQYSEKNKLDDAEITTHQLTALWIIDPEIANLKLQNDIANLKTHDKEEAYRLYFVMEGIKSSFSNDKIFPTLTSLKPLANTVPFRVPKHLINSNIKIIDYKQYFKKILSIELEEIDIKNIGFIDNKNKFSINENNELIGINLRSNGLNNISFLSEFTTLQKIYLGNNNISELSIIHPQNQTSC